MRVESTNLASTTACHKAFMSANPSKFKGKERLDRAEEWLRDVEKTFGIIKLPKRVKVKFGTYIFVGDAEAWWHTLLEIKYSVEELDWDESKNEFNQTYISSVARERKVGKFLDLI